MSMPSPLKILFVINGLGTAGAERSLAEMLPSFIDAGLHCTVACIHRRKEGVQEQVQALGVEVVFLQKTNWPARILELRALIQRIQPDILHTSLYEADQLGRLASIGTGVAVISSLVNTAYDPVRLRDPNIKPAKLRVAKFIDAWTARRFNTHFHAITHAVRASAIEDYHIPGERITVVERGRNPERLGRPSEERRALARQRLGLAMDADVLVNVARQEFQKGHRHLLEAMSLLITQRPSLQLIIAGREGHASKELQALVQQYALQNNVSFLGFRTDVPEILAAGDIFVFPSLYEGLGGAVIEAMAMGMPIVASSLPVLAEVVEENGNALLVPRESAKDLSHAIESLLQNKEMMSRFGQRSRAIFEERFTLAQSAAGMLKLYRQIASAQRQKP